MTHNKSLPPEIILKIFEEIDLEDKEMVLQCRLGCKYWNRFMKERIYHNVVLAMDFLDLCKDEQQSKRNTFIRKIISDPSVGEMVNRLVVGHWTDYDFRVYVKFCPNLRSFHCYSGCDYYTRLLTELKSGAWTKMNTIQKPVTESDQMFYNELVWFMRDRLIELHVYEQFLQDLSFTANDSLSEYFKSFTALESIKFAVDGKHIFEFDEYLDVCPRSLSKVKITSYFSGDEDYPNRAMRNRLYQITQLPWIKQLGVKSALVNDDSLIYIMHKFPSLHNLRLKDTGIETTDEGYGGGLSSETLSLFFHYLSHIRFFNLDDFYLKDPCRLLHSLINETTKRFGGKWRLAIHYQGSSYDDHSRINLVRTDKSYVGVELQVVENNMELYHTTLLENAGPQIERLEFFMEAWSLLLRQDYEFDSEILKMIEGSYMSHLLKYCTQLKELEIRQSVIFNCGFDTDMKQTHLTYLRLRRCEINLGVLEELSSHLPSLNTFVMKACSYTSDAETYIINMPWTHFKHLAWGIDACVNYDGFCTRLTDSTGTTKYYKGKLSRFDSSPVKVSKYNAEGYHSYEKSNMKLTIDIHCASIKELEITIEQTIIQIDTQS